MVAPDVEQCDAGIEVDTGVQDMKLIGDTNRLIAGLDSGDKKAGMYLRTLTVRKSMLHHFSIGLSL